MRLLSKNLFSQNKLALLIGIGMPGLSKFVFAFILQRILGLEKLGGYSSDLNIALIFSALTAAGFSVILMNRIPRISDKLEQRLLLGRHAVIANGLSVLSALLVFVLWTVGWVESFLGVVLLLIGYSNYQIYRHFLLSRFQYKSVLAVEIFILFSVSIGFFLFAKSTNPLLIHSVILLVSFVGVNILVGKIQLNELFKKDEFKSGIEFGFSGLSSTFLALMSVPLANQFLGSLYAGFLGILNPIIQLSVLVPRSLSNYYLPLLAKFAIFSSEQKKIYYRFFRLNTGFLLVIGMMLGFGWIVYVALFPYSNLILENSSIILLFMLLNLVFSQISLPGFNMLIAWDKSRLSFYLNFSVLIAFMLLSLPISFFFKGYDAFVMVYTLLIVLNLLRWGYLSFVVTNFSRLKKFV